MLNNHLIATDTAQNFSVSIPRSYARVGRAYLKLYAVKGNRCSQELLMPLNNGQFFATTDKLTRFDYEAAVIYNAFLDRFADGNQSNNPMPSNGVHPRADWHGGDVAGLTQKINGGYFDSLGVNTIWISPVVRNPQGCYGHNPNPETSFSAYHGYWPVSFNQTDERLTTPAELKTLTSTAHARNMNILLDFVSHHVHVDHPFCSHDSTFFTSLYLPDGSLNTERWDDHRLTTWFDVFLPTINFAKTEVCQMLSDSALFWLDEYQFDGLRHDAAKHVPDNYWRMLTQKIRTLSKLQNRRIYQIGETYGSDSLIGSYINPSEFDAQFDFNVYDAEVSTFADTTTSFDRLVNEVFSSLDAYGTHHLMGNITGNQDRGRFISYAGGSLRFDEDAKQAGWTRNIGVGDSAFAYPATELLFACTATLPGIPVIYYGDEIGLAGGNDPDCRRMMRFTELSDNQLHLRQTAAKLMHLRRNSMPLAYGNFKVLYQSDKQIIMSRTWFNQCFITIINKDTKAADVEFAVPAQLGVASLVPHFGHAISINADTVRLHLDGVDFECLSNY